jgi:hypothetical protein
MTAPMKKEEIEKITKEEFARRVPELERGLTLRQIAFWAVVLILAVLLLIFIRHN